MTTVTAAAAAGRSGGTQLDLVTQCRGAGPGFKFRVNLTHLKFKCSGPGRLHAAATACRGQCQPGLSDSELGRSKLSESFTLTAPLRRCHGVGPAPAACGTASWHSKRQLQCQWPGRGPLSRFSSRSRTNHYVNRTTLFPPSITHCSSIRDFFKLLDCRRSMTPPCSPVVMNPCRGCSILERSQPSRIFSDEEATPKKIKN